MATIESSDTTAQAPDRSYTSIMRQFKAFVDKKYRLPAPAQRTDKEYLTVQNVTSYYCESVKFSKNSPKTVARIKCGLQWFINRQFVTEQASLFVVEHIPGFNDVIKYQTREYSHSIMEGDIDPHYRCPTDTLSPEENIHAMKVLFNSNASNWKAMSMSWTLGNSCLIRPDTFLKLTLPKIRADTRHRPPDTTTDRCTVSYILKPYDMKGGRNNGKGKTRVVGSWRHKEYLRCAVGMLAFTLFVQLHSNDTLTFHRGPVSRRRPPWWDISLTDDWDNSGVLCNQYRRLLESANIDYCKCSYIRTSGVDEAGYEGELLQDAITTMSKHTRNKFDVFYMCELSPDVLKVLAGFHKRDIYTVPRTDITFEELTNTPIVELIFPNINIWKAQRDGIDGDKSVAARNFLDELLPFLARVVLQDGIFFMHDFPRHLVSQYLRNLRNTNTTFERWANTQRHKLNQALPPARTESEMILNAIIDLKADISEVKASVRDIKEGTGNENEQVSSPSLLDTASTRPNSISFNLNLQELVQNSSAHQSAISFNINMNPISNSANTITGSTATTTSNGPTEPASTPRTINNTLRSESTDSNVPKDFPKTVVELVNQHEVLGLVNFMNTKLTGWSRTKKIPFLRRSYVYAMVKARADNEGTSFIRAAQLMDEQRNRLGKSVSKYVDYLKDHDPNVHKRKRGESDEAL